MALFSSSFRASICLSLSALLLPNLELSVISFCSPFLSSFSAPIYISLSFFMSSNCRLRSLIRRWVHSSQSGWSTSVFELRSEYRRRVERRWWERGAEGTLCGGRSAGDAVSLVFPVALFFPAAEDDLLLPTATLFPTTGIPPRGKLNEGGVVGIFLMIESCSITKLSPPAIVARYC